MRKVAVARTVLIDRGFVDVDPFEQAREKLDTARRIKAAQPIASLECESTPLECTRRMLDHAASELRERDPMRPPSLAGILYALAPSEAGDAGIVHELRSAGLDDHADACRGLQDLADWLDGLAALFGVLEAHRNTDYEAERLAALECHACSGTGESYSGRACPWCCVTAVRHSYSEEY